MTIRKKLALSTLMTCLILSNIVQAEEYGDATTITQDGTYYFNSGSYDDQLIDLYMSNKTVNVNLNIKDQGTLKVDRIGSSALVDAYDGTYYPISSNLKAEITVNGNLDLTVDADKGANRSDVRVINLLNNHDSFTVNGDTAIKIINGQPVDHTSYFEGIRTYSGIMCYNGNFTINKLNFDGIDSPGRENYIKGIYSTTNGTDVGEGGKAQYSEIHLGRNNNDKVIIENIEASAPDTFLSVVGIVSEGEKSLVAVNGDAEIQNISGKNTNGFAEVIGIEAKDKGIVDIKGDLFIDNITGAGSENYVAALTACTDGQLRVNKDNDTSVIIQVNGDLDGDDTPGNNSALNINLLNKNSYINGASTGNVNMTLADGAKWNVRDRHLILNGNGSEPKNPKWSYVKSLSGNGGIVNLNIDASKKNSDKNNRLFIDGTHTGTHYITLHNLDTSGTYNAAGTVLVSVHDEQGEFIAKPEEGNLYWNKYSLKQVSSEAGGDSLARAASRAGESPSYAWDWVLAEAEHIPDAPTTSVDTNLGANALNYHTWILESDKLMKRMGDLRHNTEDEQGAWFRVRSSKISRNDSANFTNKYTIYDLGYDVLDKETDKYKRYVGAAISYGDGSSGFKHGSGDNSSKAIGLYGTTMREKGHYLDVVLRVVDMDSDFRVFDTNGKKISGDIDNNGVSLSAEYGRKKDIGHKWYIEPQGQLTFGYLNGDNYLMNNAVAVKQDDIKSLVGRIGFNIGRDVDEKTNLYLKANLLHEFLGDYRLDMQDTASGDTLVKEGSFSDTWVEIGVGAAIQTGKNNHVYFDLEKTLGGDFDRTWQVNGGFRWEF